MNKELNEKIEKYLQKQLEGIELKRFEEQLEKDDKLYKRVQLERELIEAISDKSDLNIFRKIVDETSEAYFNKNSSSSTFFYLKIAASVALLITASWLIWSIAKPTTPDEIFESHFEPYIIQTTPRGLIEDADDYMMGTIFYRDMNYDSARLRFEAVLNETPDDYRAMLMLGISFMALKDYKNAEKILLILVNDPNHLFQDQARWYLGLLYITDIDKGNDWRADEYFEKIEDPKLREKMKEL